MENNRKRFAENGAMKNTNQRRTCRNRSARHHMPRKRHMANGKPATDPIKSALRLNEINGFIVKAVIEGSKQELFALLEEFRYLKKSIRMDLMDTPVLTIENTEARVIMNRIISEYPFEADKILADLENVMGEPLRFNELEPKETDELQSDLFHSWCNAHDYIQGLYEIGALVLDVAAPKILSGFVSEARSCYALRKYIALYSLCRTIMEIAIRDIGTRKRFIEEEPRNVARFEKYQKDNILQQIGQISSGNLQRKIKNIYYQKTCFPIHRPETVTRQEAKELFGETMTAVQELYARIGHPS